MSEGLGACTVLRGQVEDLDRMYMLGDRQAAGDSYAEDRDVRSRLSKHVLPEKVKNIQLSLMGIQ